MVFKPDGHLRPDRRRRRCSHGRPRTLGASRRRAAGPAARLPHKLTPGRWASPSSAVAVFVFYHYILTACRRRSRTSSPTGCRCRRSRVRWCWVIMALGLNIVVGYAGLLDLGYVAFWALGGYTAGWLMSDFFNGRDSINFLRRPAARTPAASTSPSGWCCSSPACVCAIAGVIIGAPTLRLQERLPRPRDPRLRRDHPAVLPQRRRHRSGINLTNGTKGIPPGRPDQALAVRPDRRRLADLGDVRRCDVPASSACSRRSAICSSRCGIREGRLGRAWLAIREDELAASMMGVPLMRTKLSAYARRRVLRRHRRRRLRRPRSAACSPTGSTSASRSSCCAMVVLGGMGNVWGVTVGALRARLVQQHRPQRRSACRSTTRSAPTSTSPTLQLPDLRPGPGADDAVPARGLPARRHAPSRCCASRGARPRPRPCTRTCDGRCATSRPMRPTTGPS